MYVRKRKTVDQKSGKSYYYYRVVETIQTEKGPRQKTILHLGKLTVTESERKLLGKLIERRIAGKPEIVIVPKLEKIVADAAQRYHEKIALEMKHQEAEKDATYVEIDLNSTEQTYYRSVGAELLGDTFWNRLGFDTILRSCDFNRQEIEMAKTVILGRLISPASERQTINWFRHHSSLAEFLSTEIGNKGNDAFYKIGDLLYANQDKIERLLRERVKTIFPYTDSIYLYDLTNTYFEGSKLSSKLCRRAKSKEKRNDCPLVTLALVVDQHGFPLYSRIYRGNQSEPLTLEATLQKIYGEADDFFSYLEKPAIAMDRGIATKDNIAYLKANGYSYFVIERKQAATLYKQEFSTIETDGKCHRTASNQTVYLKRCQSEEETRVLVYSPQKAKKEQSMIGKKEQRFLEDMQRLIASNQKGSIKDGFKIQERIGRYKERYGAIASLYAIQIEYDTTNPHFVKNIRLIKKQKAVKEELAGCYVIETNKTSLTEEEIWYFYMKLHEVEAAFRSLKSDLGTRPVYHQLDSRIESHLFISVLAYSIMKSIVFSLNQKGVHKDWSSIMARVGNHQRATTIQKSKSGEVYYIRVTGNPEPKAREIYELLNITVKKNRIIKKQHSHL
jgi:transposase